MLDMVKVRVIIIKEEQFGSLYVIVWQIWFQKI